MIGIVIVLLILCLMVVVPYVGLLCIETIFKIPMAYSWQELLAMAGLLLIFGGAANTRASRKKE